MRARLFERFVAALPREIAEQDRLRATQDFREGSAAMAERRPPSFEER
jgi:hypothetical protein